MAWTDPVFSYCERGQNADFWAEPLNALSNAGFLIVALAAALHWARQPQAQRGAAEAALIALVATIGAGSFLFHTFANRWSNIADVAPIAIFMFAYAGYALRRYLGLSSPWVLAGLVGFAALIAVSAVTPCPSALTSAVPGPRCLNGSIAYLPALLVLAATGIATLARGDRAGRLLLAASAVFAVSLVARTLDLELCESTQLFGHARGTHAIWHLLNAGTLGLLLAAALRNGSKAPA